MVRPDGTLRSFSFTARKYSDGNTIGYSYDNDGRTSSMTAATPKSASAKVGAHRVPVRKSRTGTSRKNSMAGTSSGDSHQGPG